MKTLTGNLVGAVAAALVISVMFVVSLPSLFLRAFVLTQLWGWFLVEGYGLKALSFAASVGVLMIVSLVHSGVSGKKEDKDIDEMLGEFVRSLLLSSVLSLFVLAAGWVLHSFLF
jgi:hypothetical protein